jgi:hypothetical protein
MPSGPPPVHISLVCTGRFGRPAAWSIDGAKVEHDDAAKLQVMCQRCVAERREDAPVQQAVARPVSGTAAASGLHRDSDRGRISRQRSHIIPR